MLGTMSMSKSLLALISASANRIVSTTWTLSSMSPCSISSRPWSRSAIVTLDCSRAPRGAATVDHHYDEAELRDRLQAPHRRAKSLRNKECLGTRIDHFDDGILLCGVEVGWPPNQTIKIRRAILGLAVKFLGELPVRFEQFTGVGLFKDTNLRAVFCISEDDLSGKVRPRRVIDKTKMVRRHAHRVIGVRGSQHHQVVPVEADAVQVCLIGIFALLAPVRQEINAPRFLVDVDDPTDNPGTMGYLVFQGAGFLVV